jgi:hypothetical protein
MIYYCITSNFFIHTVQYVISILLYYFTFICYKELVIIYSIICIKKLILLIKQVIKITTERFQLILIHSDNYNHLLTLCSYERFFPIQPYLSTSYCNPFFLKKKKFYFISSESGNKIINIQFVIFILLFFVNHNINYF